MGTKGKCLPVEKSKLKEGLSRKYFVFQFLKSFLLEQNWEEQAHQNHHPKEKWEGVQYSPKYKFQGKNFSANKS